MIAFYPLLWLCGFCIGFFAPLKEKSPVEMTSDFTPIDRVLLEQYSHTENQQDYARHPGRDVHVNQSL